MVTGQVEGPVLKEGGSGGTFSGMGHQIEPWISVQRKILIKTELYDYAP